MDTGAKQQSYNTFGIPEKEWAKMVKGYTKGHHDRIKVNADLYKVNYLQLRNVVREIAEGA